MSHRSNVVARVAALTAPGAAFERVSTAEVAGDANASEQFDSVGNSFALTAQLRRRRTNAPQLLDEREWELIESLPEDQAGPAALNELRRFRSMEAATESEADWPAVLLIDTRGAQLSSLCGTRTHARNALEVVLNAVPDTIYYGGIA
jgi:hypothetical protein